MFYITILSWSNDKQANQIIQASFNLYLHTITKTRSSIYTKKKAILFSICPKKHIHYISTSLQANSHTVIKKQFQQTIPHKCSTTIHTISSPENKHSHLYYHYQNSPPVSQFKHYFKIIQQHKNALKKNPKHQSTQCPTPIPNTQFRQSKNLHNQIKSPHTNTPNTQNSTSKNEITNTKLTAPPRGGGDVQERRGWRRSNRPPVGEPAISSS